MLKISATDGKARINISYQDFIEFTKLMVRGVPVDEAWYLAEYPDVADAVKRGLYKSGKHHFVEEGYLEGRVPGKLIVDEEWYLRQYPDVAEGIGSGAITTAQEHFASHGYQEGRLPSEF